MSGLGEESRPNLIIAGISAASLLRVLAGVAIGLFILSTLGRILKFAVYWDFAYTFVESFWLDAEVGVPRFFAAALLEFVALIALAIGVLQRRDQRVWAPWWVFGALLALAGVEKIAGSHGRLAEPLGAALRSGAPGAWAGVMIGGAIAVAVAVWLGRFARTLPADVLRRVVWAAVLLLIASVGLEWAGAEVEDVHDTVAIVRYFICASLEEFIEMVSTLLFLHAFLIVLADVWPEADTSGRTGRTQA